MAPKGKIPDRWIPYKACGEVIEGTRIICFKVPISKRVQENVPEIKKIWDIPAVIAEIPKLCGVIDLTNTSRYYDPREFERANVSYKKIFMPGREIPPEEKVQEFMDTVDEFLGTDCDSVVGVHCTHGLNRTGYMVCRYMRDRLNIPAVEAISRFEVARGYEIERENYKADLLGKTEIPRSDFGPKHKRRVIKMVQKQKKLRDIPKDIYENPFLDSSEIINDSNEDDSDVNDDNYYNDDYTDTEQKDNKAKKQKLSKTQKRNKQKKNARLAKLKFNEEEQPGNGTDEKKKDRETKSEKIKKRKNKDLDEGTVMPKESTKKRKKSQDLQDDFNSKLTDSEPKSKRRKKSKRAHQLSN